MPILWIDDKTPIYTRYFAGFAGTAFLVAVLSFYDGFKRYSFKIKLGRQIFAISVAILSCIAIDATHLLWPGEVRWGYWAYPLTLMWIVGLSNAHNFVDGLASSAALIAAGFLSLILFPHGSSFIHLASMTLRTASLNFWFSTYRQLKFLWVK